ncbi:hypothetical protein [Desertivirga xinjiangensis]|uniref:hypothetical protein n=1 Tax=Desertivirga xinjiangensis TaxID=539206 RepID=UPI0021096EF0|nr:hypothetical protein [Pedobacter xinjiangensis]
MKLNLSHSLAFLGCFSFQFQAFSQDINLGPRFTSLGNMGAALQDIWSLQSNQAGLAAIERPVAAIAYQSNYLDTEISTQTALFAYPHKKNVFGISVQNYGVSVYKEQRMGLCYSKRFGSTLFVAINANIHQLSILQYGSAHTYSIEAGLQYKIGKQLLIGSHISNPGKNAFNSDVNASVPTAIQIGASYRCSDKVLLNSGLIKSLSTITDARFGLEYKPGESVALRGGINANPFRQFAGFGCKYKGLHVDVAASSHPNLGYSPQLALGYEF